LPPIDTDVKIPRRRTSRNYQTGSEVPTAGTIANQAQMVIGVGSGGQGAAPEPFLESVRLNLLPGHQCARLVLQFEYGAGL